MNWKRAWHPFVEYRGAIAVILLATILALLSMQWLGYDFSYLSTAYIGDQRETLSSSWAIYQAIDNLLHHPNDLGYSPAFYGEKAPFAFTIAPYGLAVLLLPLYWLTGQNLILTFNLYVIATFPLTAWATYVLVGYLLRPPRMVSITAGLMVAFAQCRFIHLAYTSTHPTELSTYLYILAVCCLHRLIDTPRIKWAAGLVAAFWFTMFTSGYFGAILLVTGGAILVYLVVRRTDVVTPRLIIFLAAAGAVAVILSWPFLAFRYENEVFLRGQSLDQMLRFSASVDSLFASNSLIYRGILPFTGPHALFIGFVPLVLSILAWRNRDDAASATSDAEDRAFSTRDVVILYAIIILLGYVLSLGPALRLRYGEQPIAPAPFLLLMQLPGFSGMRAVARFISMALLGTAVLSAYTLNLMFKRSPTWLYGCGLAVVTLLLAIELTPYTESASKRIMDSVKGDSGEGKFLEPVVRERDVPVYQWLAQQSPGTPIMHYPVVLPPELTDGWIGLSAAVRYLADYPLYNQPMFNGFGSYYPDWYWELDWVAFPDIATLRLLQERGIRYILVHHELMTINEEIIVQRQMEKIRDLKIDLPLVGRFGEVDVYEMQFSFPRFAVIEFDEPVYGSGWYEPLQTVTGESIQWTRDSTATIDLVLASDQDVEVEFRVYRSMAPDILDSLTLSVNDDPISLMAEADEGGGTIFRGKIPRAILEKSYGFIQLVFQTNRTVSPSELGAAENLSPFGVALDWLKIGPTIP